MVAKELGNATGLIEDYEEEMKLTAVPSAESATGSPSNGSSSATVPVADTDPVTPAGPPRRSRGRPRKL